MSAEDAVTALDDNETSARVDSLSRNAPAVAADAPLADIVTALRDHSATGLPVVDSATSRLVGWITYETVLTRMIAKNADFA